MNGHAGNNIVPSPAASKGGNIKVVVRCRPLNSREIGRGGQCLVKMAGTQTILQPPSKVDKAAKDRERERREHVFSFGKFE